MESLFVGLMFVAGFILHCFQVADRNVNQKLFPSVVEWFKTYWLSALIRGAICLTLWSIYIDNPKFAVKALAFFGMNFNMALPATKCVGGLVGYFSDSILDLISAKIPFLKRQIPEDFAGGSANGDKSD
jgi:hypothetical protein